MRPFHARVYRAFGRDGAYLVGWFQPTATRMAIGASTKAIAKLTKDILIKICEALAWDGADIIEVETNMVTLQEYEVEIMDETVFDLHPFFLNPNCHLKKSMWDMYV